MFCDKKATYIQATLTVHTTSVCQETLVNKVKEANVNLFT